MHMVVGKELSAIIGTSLAFWDTSNPPIGAGLAVFVRESNCIVSGLCEKSKLIWFSPNTFPCSCIHPWKYECEIGASSLSYY